MESNKIANAWVKLTNPLRSLSQSQINAMLNNARYGNDAKLQMAFYEIERNMPIFGICINRRQASIIERQWDIVPTVESTAAKQQAEFVKNKLLECDTKNRDGFTEAIQHLSLASFRGRAAVKPFYNEKDELILKKLQNWNILEWNGKYYWNPESDQSTFIDNTIPFVEIPENEIACIQYDRPIDYPGLTIFLRQLVGEENWARFVEKQGIPQVILTIDRNVQADKVPEFEARAMNIFNGGSGVLTDNATVQELTSARGQDPFTAFCEHQMRMIAILATGSTGVVLGDVGGGIGSELIEKQEQAYQTLVTLDCKKIANAINSTIVSNIVKHYLGKQEIACKFQYVENEKTTPMEYLTMAQTLQGMGISIDVEKLKEITKLPFISDKIDDVWKPISEEKING